MQVLWCTQDDPETNVKGQTGHPFPEDDPNRQRFTQTTSRKVKTGNSYGRDTYQNQDEITTTLEFCGYHWEMKTNPLKPHTAEAQKSLEQNEDYNRGWQDAQATYGPDISSIPPF